MTISIAITLTILVIAVILFVSEHLRVDLVALLVLGGLVLTGLVTSQDALSGFSNSAVVTVWAVFVLSGGMSRTGVANIVGRYMMKLSGQGEIRLLIVIMVVGGVLSAFMNNVGVAALLLPVVINISRKTNRPASKLLMPLAFSTLLGGLTTLIGTPSNILASDALADAGLTPFKLFDFAPVGVIVMLAGILFMVLVGRHLLPTRDVSRELHGASDLPGLVHQLEERLYRLRLPKESVLSGKTLVESRLGSVLGLNVISIIRNGHTHLTPTPNTRLNTEDELLVTGRLELLKELQGKPHLIIEKEKLTYENLISSEITVGALKLSSTSSILGETLQQLDYRKRYGVIVLALWRNGSLRPTNIDNLPLEADDILLIHGERNKIAELQKTFDTLVTKENVAKLRELEEHLIIVQIPPESTLVGKSLSESRLSEALGLAVLGIFREGKILLIPNPEEMLQARDKLLVKGEAEENLLVLQGLQALEINLSTEPSLKDLESEEVGLVEATLSPHTTLAGKTLRQLHFREKYGVSVLAIWRGGRSFRTNLRDLALRFGDAILIYGPREKLHLLGSEGDFVILDEDVQEAPHLNKAPLASLIMAGVVISVLLGLLPISIAAVIGASVMVLTGCLNMDEAYRYIDWRAVFLIAGMLPLGIAMEQTGTARFLAEGVVQSIGNLGPIAIMAGLFILASLASQIMPNPVVTVLMAPIALNTAKNLSLSPFALMIVIAFAASASFLSPVGHPTNVLIMGPGGYRFTDYIKVGLPLTIVMLIVTLLVLPIFWPLFT